MTTHIIVNILLSFPMIMIINLILNNTITDNNISKYYIIAVIFTIIELYLEVISVFILNLQGEYIVFFNTMLNAIGFAIVPLIPFNLLRMKLIGKSKKMRNLLSIPIYINVVISLASIWTGWMFVVESDNSYYRGELFLVQLVTCLFYCTMFIVLTIMQNNQYNRNDKAQFLSICVLVTFGIVIQIIFPKILMIWSTASIALIILYMILREQQFRYDDLTKVQNRNRYHKEIDYMADKEFTYVLIDLNGFKKVNDIHGHLKGDEVLYNAAKLLANTFKEVGTVFRIGGDEFCIICNKVYDKEFIEAKFVEIHIYTKNHIKDFIIPNLFAYGIVNNQPNKKMNILETIRMADEAMYECKKNSKQ